MAVERAERLSAGPEPVPARFHLWNLVVWSVLTLPLAAGVAAISMHAQQSGFAPVVLQSVLVGTLLGIGLAWATRVSGMGHRPSGLVAALIVALSAAAGQHAVAYRAYRKAYQAAERSSPPLARVHATDPSFGPAGPRQFLSAAARNGQAWFWLLDASLITVTTLLILNYQLHQPYCGRCRSWYRTIERGKLSSDRVTTLVAAIGIRQPPAAETYRYRLLGCSSGCGPAGFELSWGSASPGKSHCWLTPSQRQSLLVPLQADHCTQST